MASGMPRWVERPETRPRYRPHSWAGRGRSLAGSHRVARRGPAAGAVLPADGQGSLADPGSARYRRDDHRRRLFLPRPVGRLQCAGGGQEGVEPRAFRADTPTAPATPPRSCSARSHWCGRSILSSPPGRWWLGCWVPSRTMRTGRAGTTPPEKGSRDRTTRSSRMRHFHRDDAGHGRGRGPSVDIGRGSR